MSIEGLYDIRPVREEDRAFIASTFLRGLYYGNEFYRLIDKSCFMNNYKLVVNALLNSPKIETKVACLKEDSNVILGYSILSPKDQAVIWIFIKSPWRQQGIGRSLLPASVTTATHFTTLSLQLIKKLPDCVFNPFKVQL